MIFPYVDKEKQHRADKLISGNIEFLYSVFNSICDYDDKTIDKVAKTCMSIVSDRDTKKIISLIEKIRKMFYDDNNRYNIHKMDYDKLKRCSGENFPALLAVGMFNPDGYCREKCTALMSDYPEFLPIIIHKYNDWVPEVRAAAENAFMSAAESANITDIIYAYAQMWDMRGKKRLDKNKFAGAEEYMKKRMAAEFNQNIIDDIMKITDINERRRIYYPLICNKAISRESVRYIMKNEKRPLREWTALLMISRYDFGRKELIEFTLSKMSRLRTAAVYRLCSERGDLWQDAERLLCDKSRMVRNLMVYEISKNSEFDFRKYYRGYFPKAEAIMGLGEIGNRTDEAEIIPYLNSKDEKTAAAAVYALGKLTSDENDYLYYNLISDPRPKVSKNAFNAFMSCYSTVPPKRVYEDILKCDDGSPQQSRLVSVLCFQPTGIWAAMPQLLKLYNSDNETIRNKVRMTIDKRSHSFTVSRNIAEDIRISLSECVIPTELKEKIEFEIKKF